MGYDTIHYYVNTHTPQRAQTQNSTTDLHLQISIKIQNKNNQSSNRKYVRELTYTINITLTRNRK